MGFIDLQSKEYQVYLADQEADKLGAVGSTLYLPLLAEWLTVVDYRTIHVLEIGASIFSAYDWFLQKYNNHIDGMELGTYALKYQDLSEQGPAWTDEKKSHFKCPADAHRLLDYYQPCSYDLIIAFHCFEHMIDLPLVLKNCYDVLKPGGHLYDALPSPSHNWHRGHWYEVENVAAMEQLGRNAGFTPVQSLYLNDLRYRPECEMINLFRK